MTMRRFCCPSLVALFLATLMITASSVNAISYKTFFVPDGAYCSSIDAGEQQAVARVLGTDLSLTLMKSNWTDGCHIPPIPFRLNPHDTIYTGGAMTNSSSHLTVLWKSYSLRFNERCPQFKLESDPQYWETHDKPTLYMNLTRVVDNATVSMTLVDCERTIYSTAGQCDKGNTFCSKENRVTLQILPDNRYQVEVKSSNTSNISCVASGFLIRNYRLRTTALFRVNENAACKDIQFEFNELFSYGWSDCNFYSTFTIGNKVFHNQQLNVWQCALEEDDTRCFTQPDCTSCAQQAHCAWCGYTKRCMLHPNTTTTAATTGQFECPYDQRAPGTCRNSDHIPAGTMCGYAPWSDVFNPVAAIVNFDGVDEFVVGFSSMKEGNLKVPGCVMQGTYLRELDGSYKFFTSESYTCPGTDKFYFMSLNNQTEPDPVLTLDASYIFTDRTVSMGKRHTGSLTTCKPLESFPNFREHPITGPFCNKEQNATWEFKPNNRYAHSYTLNGTKCYYTGYWMESRLTGFVIIPDWTPIDGCPLRFDSFTMSWKNDGTIGFLTDRFAPKMTGTRWYYYSQEYCPTKAPTKASPRHDTNGHDLSRGALAGIVVAGVVALIVVVAIVVVATRSGNAKTHSDDEQSIQMTEKEEKMVNSV